MITLDFYMYYHILVTLQNTFSFCKFVVFLRPFWTMQCKKCEYFAKFYKCANQCKFLMEGARPTFCPTFSKLELPLAILRAIYSTPKIRMINFRSSDKISCCAVISGFFSSFRKLMFKKYWNRPDIMRQGGCHQSCTPFLKGFPPTCEVLNAFQMPAPCFIK